MSFRFLVEVLCDGCPRKLKGQFSDAEDAASEVMKQNWGLRESSTDPKRPKVFCPDCKEARHIEKEIGK